jgi:hypothetical protein
MGRRQVTPAADRKRAEFIRAAVKEAIPIPQAVFEEVVVALASNDRI